MGLELEEGIFERSTFPKDFLWGSATSAYQVEGNNFYSDWYKWERSPARVKKLIQEGKNPEDFFSGKACDHYHRYPEDLKLLANSGQNAYRFSIEWARIEPSPGKFSNKEICHYRNFIQTMLDLRITPLLTLWQFSLPQWLAEIGGWENPNTPDYFARYVEKVMKELGELCDFWTTLNEPNVYLFYSFLTGVWPPQKRNLFSLFRAEKNFITAHNKAYEVIRKHLPRAKIGLAYAFNDIEPANAFWRNAKLSSFIDYLIHFRFVNKIENYLDFIGVNYYTAVIVPSPGTSFPKSDMGWIIYPKGIYNVLKKIWKRYRLPIIITENGIADTKDTKRAKFIKDHLHWMKKAVEEGVDVRGYFYWSLMDNFEWVYGFWPKFGLIEVDRKTLKRRPRKSFYFYSEICRSNGSLI